MESGLANMAAEGEVPALEPQMLSHKAIVKVFVIDHNEGFWLDCGAGDAQFVVDGRPSAMADLQAAAVCISVLNTYEEPQSRDFIDPVRERKLRNAKDDKNTLLEVNFGQAADFNKCQCTIVSQATIISWEQKDINESIALSFLDPWDCRDYWKVICAVTKRAYVEDLYDIAAENMKNINRRIEDDPELKSAYINALLNKVAAGDQTSAMQALREAYYDNRQSENWAQMVELAKFLERIIVAKNQELILLLLKENWKETFGTLDYSPHNYDLSAGKFRVRYLNFIENEARMMPSRSSVPPAFVRQVQLRYRVMFLFEYVMLNHFSEESMMFVATVVYLHAADELGQHATHGNDPDR